MFKLRNMKSSKTGSPVPNQFEIETDLGRFFQSYESMIAWVDNEDNIFLDPEYYSFSTTTSNYLRHFLNLTRTQITEGVTRGEIKFKDLNNKGDQNDSK